jgi:hypothetical protein
MAIRGSGIGASIFGGLGAGGVGGSQQSVRAPTRGAAYGPPATSGGSTMPVHQWLWILVLLEMLGLVALRYLFRDHRGG